MSSSYLDNFHFQVRGNESRPKLVFLHGLLGSGMNWSTIAKHFLEDFHVLTFDQRGHGRSFHPPTGYAPEDYAEDLRRILDELAWERVFLVGHSMGGRNAVRFTDFYPQRVEKLVIEDIGPNVVVESEQRIETILKNIPVPFKDKGAARMFFQNDFHVIFSDRPDILTLKDFLYSNLTSGAGGVTWRFSVPGILQTVREAHQNARWQDFIEIKVPTLLIRGENSQELPVDVFQELLRRNSQIQGLEIPQAGHWVHSDQPDAFVRALHNYLN